MEEDKDGPNVGKGKRVARVAGRGLVAGLAVAFLVGGTASLWLIALEGVAIALGVDFVITGLTGHCPIYKKLGWSTVRTEGR